MFYDAFKVYGFELLYTRGKSIQYNQPVRGLCPSDNNNCTDIYYLYILVYYNYVRVFIAMCILIVYSLVGSCGVGGSGDLVRRGAGGVLPPHHPHPHPADFPHPLRFNCMDICSSFATVGSLSKYNKHNDICIAKR